MHSVLRSPGGPLDVPTRHQMERQFGRDFAGVRLHTDARAAESARAVDASAYTVGNHVVFGASPYRPWTESPRVGNHYAPWFVHYRALKNPANHWVDNGSAAG